MQNGRLTSSVFRLRVCVLLSATITVQSGWFDFPAEEWADVSPAALGFIRSLLRPDPLLRMTADEALEVSDAHR